MTDIKKELITLTDLHDSIHNMKHLSLFMGKEQREQLNKLEAQINDMIRQIDVFTTNFSDRGWIAYDNIKFSVIEEANKIFLTQGIDEAEKVLIDYYTNGIEDEIKFFRRGVEAINVRYDLFLKAYEDHKAGRYYSSVPLLLIIADGAVNDYTKSKGFFGEGTEIDAWDCLVGCSVGLSKAKSIFCSGRYKTNFDPIFIPYRNGILHGRDLNYSNDYVSCKCIALLFALRDWMLMKNSEAKRKDKFLKDHTTPSWSELFKSIAKNAEDKKLIENWNPRKIIIGEDIPENGNVSDYSDYLYVQQIVQMLGAWKSKNFGYLSRYLKNMFSYEQSEKLRAGECRSFFKDKSLLSYKLKEIEERGCSQSRVMIEVIWDCNSIEIINLLEFGLTYEDENGKLAFPWNENGNWIIYPWNIQGLYE